MTPLIAFLLWACVTSGLTYGVTESALLGSLRVGLASVSDFLLTGLYCRKCIGFWAGMAASPILPMPEDMPLVAQLAVSGLAGAGFMWLACGFLHGHESWEFEEKIIQALRHRRQVKRAAREKASR